MSLIINLFTPFSYRGLGELWRFCQSLEPCRSGKSCPFHVKSFLSSPGFHRQQEELDWNNPPGAGFSFWGWNLATLHRILVSASGRNSKSWLWNVAWVAVFCSSCLWNPWFLPFISPNWPTLWVPRTKMRIANDSRFLISEFSARCFQDWGILITINNLVIVVNTFNLCS